MDPLGLTANIDSNDYFIVQDYVPFGDISCGVNATSPAVDALPALSSLANERVMPTSPMKWTFGESYGDATPSPRPQLLANKSVIPNIKRVGITHRPVL